MTNRSPDIRIGDLVLVRARGIPGTRHRPGIPADMHIPVARYLRVVIADAKDPLLLGKRFTVRALDGGIRDHERHRQELTLLSAYGMRIASLRRTESGFDILTVGRDPGLEPGTDPRTGAPFTWGDSGDRLKRTPFLEMEVSVDSRALPFIRLPEGMAIREMAA